MAPEPLFNEGSLVDFLDEGMRAAAARVAVIPEAQFLATAPDTVVEHVVSGLQLEPLQLSLDLQTLSTREANISVPAGFDYGLEKGTRVTRQGFAITLSVPWVGTWVLWGKRLNLRFSVPSRAKVMPDNTVRSGTIEIARECTQDADPEILKRELAQEIGQIQQLLQAQAAQIQAYHGELPHRVRSAVEDRRSSLEKLRNIERVLDVPLARNPNAPPLAPILVSRRAPPALETPPGGVFKSEPGIRSEDYEFILDVIRHEGRTYESVPATFAALGEEVLRDILLAHLNGHFKGAATAETFRKLGKTDIRIEMENRAAFVAECKMWRGAASVTEAIDQLLGYLTWRDSKAALVLFNTEVSGFSSLLEKTPEALRRHHLMRRERQSSHAGEWRLMYSTRGDAGREVTIHVFLFDLHVPKSTAATDL